MIRKLTAYVHRGDSLRLDALARAAARVAVRGGGRWLRRRGDLTRPTYAAAGPTAPLLAYLAAFPQPRALAPAAAAACERYARHEVDLLGSGWVQVCHGMACAGLEGVRFPSAVAPAVDRAGEWLRGRVTRANLAEAQRVWRLVDANYVPLDWQLDFKSGYRWSETTWYAEVRYGGVRGADVKVPWELGRGQHLPQLALAFAATGDARWARSVRNEILDFVATNPPRFGVQWCSTMDVAIRVANWLAAYDLCRAAGAAFDREFEEVLARSTLEHARHIAANLEWHPEHRGNHYLADVVGLLFAAAYLPRSRECDAWLAFAVQQLVNEVEYQFGDDGTNFEASTCYHRLSTEMAVHAAALVLGLPPDKLAALDVYDPGALPGGPPLRPAPLARHPLADGRTSPLPAWLVERLERAGEFVWRITKPGGTVAQVGDNDNGRFLKLESRFHTTRCPTGAVGAADASTDEALAQDHLDHRHLADVVGALFGREDLRAFAAPGAPAGLDAAFVRTLAGGRTLPAGRRTGAAGDDVRIGAGSASAQLVALDADTRLDVMRQTLAFPEGGLRRELRASAFPDFGLYVLRSERLFLTVRCGSIGQAGYGGHAHNDQLALELAVDGLDVLADPGTYLYTPIPERRDEYRSVLAHTAPRVAGAEPSRLTGGLFILRDDPRAACLVFDDGCFLGRHTGYGTALHRHVAVHDDRIVITDYLDPGAAGLRLDRAARFDAHALPPPVPFSPGYGLVCR